MLGVFEITGKILVYNDQTHEEFLEDLFSMFKDYNMFFVGETKNITDEYIINDEV